MIVKVSVVLLLFRFGFCGWEGGVPVFCSVALLIKNKTNENQKNSKRGKYIISVITDVYVRDR